MSRIGKRAIKLPSGVMLKVEGRLVEAKGPKGSLSRTIPEGVEIEVAEGMLQVTRASESRHHRARHGLVRALLSNMVIGVSSGFVRELEIVGVGYKAETADGKLVKFSLGHSHPVEVTMPDGIKAEVEARGTKVKLSGIDRELLGQTAANIRGLRPPEPYKGKGIKYVEEVLRRKVGKAGAG